MIIDVSGLRAHLAIAMQIARDAGYKGHVGIEYEGHSLTEVQGIKATQLLLNRCFAKV